MKAALNGFWRWIRTRERLENTMDVLKIKFGPIKGFLQGKDRFPELQRKLDFRYSYFWRQIRIQQLKLSRMA